MDINDPLPRLLRLRSAVAASVPEADTEIDERGAGLVTAYEELRRSALELLRDLGVAEDELERELPRLQEAPDVDGPLDEATDANSAATLLRRLAGYLGGVVEFQALKDKVSKEELAAAREAAKGPFGFH